MPNVSLEDLSRALVDILKRASHYQEHHVLLEQLSVRERMSNIVQVVGQSESVDFSDLFLIEEGKRGVVVTLLALLELVRESLVELVQVQTYGAIHVRGVTRGE